MSKRPAMEYWVMRVLLHEGRGPVQLSLMTPGAYIATMALITAGSLAMLPDGCICEPVEVFDEQEQAHELRARLMRENTGADFRVVISATV